MSREEKQGVWSKAKAAWGKVVHNPTFTIREQFGYSSGIMGNSMAQDVEAYALTLFLTRFMGIAASFVIVLELVAKIANIIVDPLAGVILDRKGKHGRSRAIVLHLAPVNLIKIRTAITFDSCHAIIVSPVTKKATGTAR